MYLENIIFSKEYGIFSAVLSRKDSKKCQYRNKDIFKNEDSQKNKKLSLL